MSDTTVPTMPETPECDRMLVVAPESQKIGEFLDWLSEQGIHLASYEEVEEYRDEQLVVRHEPFDRLLARYFEIDLKKVEAERRAILAAIQTGN